MHGDDLDAKELHLLVDRCHVRHVSGQAIQSFDNHHVELAGVGIGKQAENASPAMQRCARLGFIFVRLHDVEALAPGKSPAQVDLIFGGFLVLKVRRKPGVNRCPARLILQKMVGHQEFPSAASANE
ncbi:hypothetical protein ABMA46_07260 [Mesorhizobium sp. CN5-321]